MPGALGLKLALWSVGGSLSTRQTMRILMSQLGIQCEQGYPQKGPTACFIQAAHCLAICGRANKVEGRSVVRCGSGETV